MKIKTDFVTNSSSSCYVVFIPDRYKPSQLEIEKAYKQQSEWWDEEEDETPLDKMNLIGEALDCIEDLKCGADIYQDNSCDDGVDYRVYGLAETIVSNAGFGMTSISTCGDGCNQIVGVPEDKVMKVLTDYIDVSSFVKVRKGCNDEKE